MSHDVYTAIEIYLFSYDNIFSCSISNIDFEMFFVDFEKKSLSYSGGLIINFKTPTNTISSKDAYALYTQYKDFNLIAIIERENVWDVCTLLIKSCNLTDLRIITYSGNPWEEPTDYMRFSFFKTFEEDDLVLGSIDDVADHLTSSPEEMDKFYKTAFG